MSTIYSIFGDKGKAQELKNEILSITQEFKTPATEVKTPTTEVKVASSETIEALEERTLILNKGFTNIETLKIKSLIQEKVLDPIQAAAAKAKWHEEWGVSSITTDYGVAGYVEEDYLKKILGTNFTETNYKIALGLCFEAINIGIMSSPDKNPLAAAIFCTKYSVLINEILDSHPEYFVDGHILKTSLLNASNYSTKLLGEENVTVNTGYNKLFEAAIIPFVTERIESTVLTPLKELVAGDGWSSWHTSEVKKYLSEEFLLNGYTLSASALGNNLGQIPDIINIVRILAFKTIATTITEKGSTNFIPIEKFIKAFPDLNIRIIEDHREYLNNKFISKLCTNAQSQHSAKVVAEEMDLFTSVILSPQNTGEIKLVGELPQNDQASGDHNDGS